MRQRRTTPQVFIADAHLDLAYNALRGRDLSTPANLQPKDEEGTPTVSLPDLRAGGVGLICATIFCEPYSARAAKGYRSADEARQMALAQMQWYQQQETQGNLSIVRSRAAIQDLGAGDAPRQPRAIVLVEGADPIEEGQVAAWYERGVRAVGLAWKRTRYAGGTGESGPLTDAGRRLVGELDAAGMIHDVSHLAEESFWELLDRSTGPIMASHSNCRAIVPTDRQLSDQMIRAVAGRDGIIGINFYTRFLLPPDTLGQRPATLGDVVRHVRYICDLLGDAQHVGLGTDMDGGFGREHLPAGINTSADLYRLAEELADEGFADADVRAIMGGNWARFFNQKLGG